jgi:LPXTG-motif cell wall-anchored protein
VTGELPAESAADAEDDATSGTTTLLGMGLLALLGAGAAFTAYRRRSQQP